MTDDLYRVQPQCLRVGDVLPVNTLFGQPCADLEVGHGLAFEVVRAFTSPRISATGTPSPAANLPAVFGSHVPRRTIVEMFCLETPHFSANAALVNPCSARIVSIFVLLMVIVSPPISFLYRSDKIIIAPLSFRVKNFQKICSFFVPCVVYYYG